MRGLLRYFFEIIKPFAISVCFIKNTIQIDYIVLEEIGPPTNGQARLRQSSAWKSIQ